VALPLLLALSASLAWGAKTLPPSGSLPGGGALATNLPPALAVKAEAPPVRPPAPVWLGSLKNGFAMAGAQFTPVLALFTSPDCVWCNRLKSEVLMDPAVADLLPHFTLVEIDVTRNEEDALRYRLRGVPVILILSADGEVKTGVDGFVTASQLQGLLRGSLNPEFLRKKEASYLELLKLLEDNQVPTHRWADIMLSMGAPERRRELYGRIMTLAPFPRQALVGLLDDPRLAVRLGALDLIEEVSGDIAGYDAWLDQDSGETNRLALLRLRTWANGGTNEADMTVKAVFTALTREQVLGYLQDLLSDNRDRSIRALRLLENGGPSVIPVLGEFLQTRTDLAPGLRNRVKEVQYVLCLKGDGGLDASTQARRLLYGTLDMRVKALSGLTGAGARAMPILTDFLEDRDAMAREAAADTLVAAAGEKAVPLLKDRLAREKDNDVTYSILTALGKVRGRRAQDILVGYLTHRNEDLVQAALKSLGAMKSAAAESDIGRCLKDERWRVRVAALETVAVLKLSGLEGAVTGMLADKDPFVRFSAVKTLPALSAKRALKQLEEVFLKEDELKAPIVAAYTGMETPLPAVFGKALQGKGRDVILGVLESMEDGCEKDMILAEPFLDDADPDIAGAATRLIAAKGLGNSRCRARLRDILEAGKKDRVIQILEAARMPRPDRYDAPAPTIDWSEPDNTATGKVPASAVEDVLNAFSSEPSGTAPAATGAPPAGVQAPAPGAAVDDILAAFGEGESPGAAEAAEGTARTCSLRDFGDAVERQMRKAVDEDTRFKAALLLASMKNPRVMPFLEGAIASRTIPEKVAAVGRIGSFPAKQTASLVGLLLQDPAEEVRQAAAMACFPYEGNPLLLETALKALRQPGARLKPYDLPVSRMEQACREAPGRRVAGEWARKVLAESGDVILQNLALMVLEHCWKPSDTKTVWTFTRSAVPWQRRAAFHALGKNDQQALARDLVVVVQDASEHVRMVVPSVYMRTRDRWINYFDAAHFEETSGYFSMDSDEGAPRLSPPVREALQKLTLDSSPAVRVEAFFCLMFNRETVDLARFVATVESFPDRTAIASRVGSFLTSSYQHLGRGFRVLVPFIGQGGRSEEYVDRVREHFKMDAETADMEIVTRSAGAPVEATYLPVAPRAGGDRRQSFRLVYFSSPGCSVCDKVERMLAELGKEFPGLAIESHNIRKLKSMQMNEALCERFRVPEKQRLVAPAVFGGGGVLARDEVTPAALRDLVLRSEALATEDWYTLSAESLAQADTVIQRRGRAMSLGVIALAGLLDGVNPCAFATIIFLLSYLQITRRSPREVARVGLAFVAGVFLAYLVLGLGLVELLTRIQHVLVWFRKALNWTLAAFTLVIFVLNVRDGILCLRGRLGDMTLQLPGFLKGRIHGVIRQGSRHAHFVIAAFVVGVVVSGIELACTGQVYFPTIGYMLEQGADRRGALAYLALYNTMFILPLLAIFVVACFGLTHAKLTDLLHRHAALVKFCTAALFLVLFLFFVFGDRLVAVLNRAGGYQP
jgi:cytochrome c biogenesis protein CcdA/HEAT repeat protein/thioredoxin-related protein